MGGSMKPAPIVPVTSYSRTIVRRSGLVWHLPTPKTILLLRAASWFERPIRWRKVPWSLLT